MKKLFIQLLLVATMLFGLLGSETGVRAEGLLAQKHQDEQQISRHDGLSILMAEEPEVPTSILRNPPSSHRIAASRSFRLLPTHGGKPGQHYGRYAGRYSSNPLIALSQPLQFCQRVCRADASPRLYYVIALRRLLC